MGYLHRCHYVSTTNDTWSLEKIHNVDEILSKRQKVSSLIQNQEAIESDSQAGRPIVDVSSPHSDDLSAGRMEPVDIVFKKERSQDADGSMQIVQNVPMYIPPLVEDEQILQAHRTKLQNSENPVFSVLLGQESGAGSSGASNDQSDSDPESKKDYLCCEDYNNCCDGGVPGSMPISTWNHIRAFSSTYHVRELLDSTPRMLERHYTFFNLMSKNQLAWNTILNTTYLFLPEQGGGAWYVDCMYGAMTILLNALPAVEFEWGLKVTQDLYLRVAHLMRHVSDVGMKLSNWTIPIDPLFGHNDIQSNDIAKSDSDWQFKNNVLLKGIETSPMSVILGLANINDWIGLPENPLFTNDLSLVERATSSDELKNGRCFGTDLRIFVHETDEFEKGGLFCSAGQWGVEVLLHRYLMRSSCRTDDPNDADLFWVPDYRACHWHLTPKPNGGQGLTTKNGDIYSIVIQNHQEKVRDVENPDALFKRLLAKIEPWFSRHHGVDHIFTFSDQGFIVNFTHTFPSWREHIHSSIFLTTEAFTPGYGPSCFSPWKDFTIPGHLDPYRVQEIRKFNKPSENRTLLFSFHGRSGSNHAYYKNIKIRLDIERLFKNLEDTSIGDFTPKYFEIIGNSHFCLIPEGTSAWTNHLYTSFFAGCIPIILSDKFVLPFQDIVNWNRLTVRWPQEKISMALYEWAKTYVSTQFEELKRTKELIDLHQCWFDWYDFDKLTECSPYKAIFKSLATRKKTVKYRHQFGWIGHAEPLGSFYSGNDDVWRTELDGKVNKLNINGSYYIAPKESFRDSQQQFQFESKQSESILRNIEKDYDDSES